MSNGRFRKVHERNVELFTEEFDAVREQARLERLTRVESVKVGIILGRDLIYAMHGGKVGVVHGYTPDEQFNGCYLVQYRKGKLLHPDGQVGAPRDFGPFLIRFYQPDRVAEILRLDMEAA